MAFCAMEGANSNRILVRRYFSGLRIAKQINWDVRGSQTRKSQLSVAIVSSYDTDITGAVMFILEQGCNFFGEELTLGCFIRTANYNWTTALSNTEFRARIRHRNISLSNIFFPLIFH